MSRIVYHRTRLPLGPGVALALAAVLAAWGWRLTLPVPQAAVHATPAVAATPRQHTAATAATLPLPSAVPQAATPAGLPRPAAAAMGIIAPAAVLPQQLTVKRLLSAQAFLNEVQLAPSARGGFVVLAVEPDSRWQRMGLRPGDVVYTLDTPAMAAIDDTSMIALMQQTSIELDVYRAGTLMRLHYSINRDEARSDDAGSTPS